MKNVRITYESDGINVEFDNALRKFMKGFMFEPWASGYDLTINVRDLAFEPQDIEEEQVIK